jgi:hypothetical protein
MLLALQGMRLAQNAIIVSGIDCKGGNLREGSAENWRE